MTDPLLRAARAIDRFSLWSGRLVAWLIVPMVLCLVWEVAARYLFMAPTIWAYDLTYMLYGTFFMLGSAYTLARKGHIRTDTFYGEWSPRTQGIVDSLCYVIFIPALIAMLWVGWFYFQRSFLQDERIVTSPWMPIVWPFKFAIPLTAAMLLVQSLSELIKSLHAARTGHWPAGDAR
ncbi:MAG TPA: TRAP transporter small permease subunit [Geminicoccus sp.]|uniref:TRAP transporter small permease subunit n=1 Tax=Geminicoccus sp. TaxID=2024832 RepID=UPI002C05A830|nr:TRAP transporter small permease subunit [Geminicoccus sp.]HWL71752.1 TRAP transporter small permease subunit [Geminicoccus sp.]